MKRPEQIKLLHNKTDKDLAKELNELYTKLQKLQFSQSFGKLKDITEIKKTRRLIARIWTTIAQRDIKHQLGD